jgi:hypothetical protein
MELVLSAGQIGNRDAKYEMNLDDSFHCLMKSREMGVEDWRARKYLEMIHWGRDGDGKARTISAGCKKFKDFQFLMRLLAASGRDESRIVEQNLRLETKPMHSRLLNPISALQDKANYKGTVEEIVKLRSEGWRVRDLVIHGDYLHPEVGWIDEIWNWWEEVHVGLRRVARGGKVKLIFSREVSVHSLERRTYHPHVHVMYLYKGGDPVDRFEKFLPNMSISPDVAPVRNPDGLTRYFFGVSTPREAYRREWTPETSKVINTSVWEWMDEIQALYYNRKRIGKFGFGSRCQNVSLPSVPEENKIIEDNYIYEKRTRLSIGCGRRDCGRWEPTVKGFGRTGIFREGGDGEVEHGGVHRGSRERVTGVSSWPEGGHAGGGCRGGSNRGTFQRVGRGPDPVHGGVGEGGESIHASSRRWIDECAESGHKGIKTTHVGECGKITRIHGERSAGPSHSGPGSG